MTRQSSVWQGRFGEEYTQRNTRTAEEWDQYYLDNYGLTKIEMNRHFLGGLPPETSFLEVGCNTGQQLQGLSRMGFSALTGVDVQMPAARTAGALVPGAAIACASALALPFRDESFDVVFTAGVLIHIAPEDIAFVMREMGRCARRFLWGFEYFADAVTEIPYRGNSGLLWKGDYAKMFGEACPGFTLIRREIFPYVNDTERGNADAMYLLEKL